jgi:hypothetical protein
MKNKIGKGLASIAAAAICGLMLYMTNGVHGIGWFLVCLFVIWQS